LHREDLQTCFLQEDQARLQISGDQEKMQFSILNQPGNCTAAKKKKVSARIRPTVQPSFLLLAHTILVSRTKTKIIS